MSIRRRQQLVRLAREYNALIIADDVYDHLRWGPDPSAQERVASVIPRLVDIDHGTDGGTDRPGADGFGNAISNGSFSKIIGPGLRTGWTEATEMFARGLSQCGSTVSGGSPSQLCAVIISHMLDGGGLVQHMDEVLIPSLQRRHQLITRAIKQHLEPLGATMSSSNGGYFIWITLPAQVSAKYFAIQAASAENVVVAPGHLFEVPSGGNKLCFDREIRVCYAWEREEALGLGVEKLGRILTTILYGVKRNRTSMRNLPDTADAASAHLEGSCVMASLS
jgi:DNA-binding transcriptional MocR family regulator